MSPSRKHSVAVNLEAKDERVRRNSVSILPTRPGRASTTASAASSPSERVAGAPRRRLSSKTTMEKFLQQGVHPPANIAGALEFLTWSHLLKACERGELETTTVRKAEVVVAIPVCQVTRPCGATISVTSVDAIDQTLSYHHPSLQVLLGSPGSSSELLLGSFFSPDSETGPLPSGVRSHLSCSPYPSPVSSKEPPPTPSRSFGSKGANYLSDLSPSAHATESAPSSLPGHAPASLPAQGRKGTSEFLKVNVEPGNDSEIPAGRVPSSSKDGANAEMTDLDTGKRLLSLRRRSSQNLLKAEGAGPRRVSINTCIRTMREGSGNYDSQLLGCQNVGHYAGEETLKVVLAKSDAISCVISAMKAFLDKEELQRQACASLLKMASTSEANCVYISRNDGVTAITNTMRRHEESIDVTRLALGILGYISTTEEVTAELLSYGCHSDVLAAMSRHSDDRTIVRQCCFILGNLVISVETAQQLMLVGGVHTIISMLKRYHDDRDILENGCRALGSFALYDETCLDVAQAGATETVLEAMTSPHSDVSVLESCCWALACLTSMASTCEELVNLQGLPALLHTLEQFAEEELLQDYGVRTLCNVGGLETTVAHVSIPRVIHVLTSLYRNFPDNVELLEYMMLALSQVAAVDSDVQHLLLTEGGLKTVVSVMKCLEENPAIQENGCRILGNLAVNAALRKSTEQQGASQVVISAMLNIEMCPDIQLYGCMALMNLTADLMDNKMRVKNNGAVPTLLATLRKFADNTEVVLSALKTLGNLVDLEEACRQLLDDRGLSTIVDIAKDDKADENIRAFSALVLSGLTALSDLPVDDLLTVEETLVTLQAAQPDDPDLALSMCQGLHNLLKSEVGLETLTQTGWMDVIENAMNKFTTHPDIHLTSCRIVATVAMECRRRPEEARCPLSQGTVRTVLVSMRQFPHEKELQLVGSAALSCVCECFGHLRQAIVEEGGLRDVTSALTSFPRDDRLHSVGLIALSYLLPVDVHDHPEDAAMAIEVISRSMSQFVENEEIQISACRALERCDVRETDGVLAVLTHVHSAVRRHSGKVKVLKAAGKVFKRFGGGNADDITQRLLESPMTPLSELLAKTTQSGLSTGTDESS